jgi:hypothetical protein
MGTEYLSILGFPAPQEEEGRRYRLSKVGKVLYSQLGLLYYVTLSMPNIFSPFNFTMSTQESLFIRQV